MDHICHPVTLPPTKANHVLMIYGMEENILLLGVQTIVRTHYITFLATGTTSTYYYFQENGQNLSNYN